MESEAIAVLFVALNIFVELGLGWILNLRNSLKLVLRKCFSYEICERFTQTFLQRVPKAQFTLSERSSCKVLFQFWDRTLYRIHVHLELSSCLGW